MKSIKPRLHCQKIIIDKPAVNKYGSPIALLEGIDFNDDDGDKQDTEVPEEKLNDFRGFSIGNGGFRCGLPGKSRCPEEDGRTGPGYPGTREPTQEKVPEPADSQFTDSPIEPGQRSGGCNWQNSSPEGDEEEFPEYPDVIPSTPEKGNRSIFTQEENATRSQEQPAIPETQESAEEASLRERQHEEIVELPPSIQETRRLYKRRSTTAALRQRGGKLRRLATPDLCRRGDTPVESRYLSGDQQNFASLEKRLEKLETLLTSFLSGQTGRHQLHE